MRKRITLSAKNLTQSTALLKVVPVMFLRPIEDFRIEANDQPGWFLTLRGDRLVDLLYVLYKSIVFFYSWRVALLVIDHSPITGTPKQRKQNG